MPFKGLYKAVQWNVREPRDSEGPPRVSQGFPEGLLKAFERLVKDLSKIF